MLESIRRRKEGQRRVLGRWRKGVSMVSGEEGDIGKGSQGHIRRPRGNVLKYLLQDI